MTAVMMIYDRLFGRLEAVSSAWAIPTLARIVFAGVLLMYFWRSAMTKVGDGVFGIFNPSVGAYAQIFPQKAEAVLFDVTQFSFAEKLVILAGTWGEFILPLLIVIGLFTRLAALGMIVFVVVQSYVDITGHNADAETIGSWFDGASGALIVDQRAFWIFLFIVLFLRGPGPLSVDRYVGLEGQRT